jgi:predicted dehydrogenase
LSAADSIRTGLIGSGFAASTLASAARLAPGVRFTGVFGGRGAGDLAARHGWEEHRSLASLLDSGLEAAVVATPHDLHAEQVEAALEAGLHVFCEKPFVVDPAAGERLCELAEQSGRVLGVNHFQRFRLSNRAAREALADGAIGRLLGIQARLLEGPMRLPWQQRGENDGFFLGYGVHAVDLVCWWVGEEAVDVSMTQALDDDRVERATAAHLRFAGGASASILATDRSPGAGDGQVGKAVFESLLVGSEGVLRVDSYGEAAVETPGERRVLARLPRWRSANSKARLAAYAESLQGFAEAVLDGGEPPVSGREGLAAIEVCVRGRRRCR